MNKYLEALLYCLAIFGLGAVFILIAQVLLGVRPAADEDEGDKD